MICFNLPFIRQISKMQQIISFALFLSILGTNAQLPPLLNVPYGSDPAQVMDIYLPSNEGNVEKVVVLIHGGAWGGGQKSDMNSWVPKLQRDHPGHCIVNMEYRLGTLSSPGFPKQLEDISMSLAFLQQTFTTEVTFSLIGTSAGGHLSMLYSYTLDSQAKKVKVVVSHVGPGDLTDPGYTENPLLRILLLPLVGNCLYNECPEIYSAVSPVKHVTSESTKTIGFYGNADALVPNNQMPIIRDALNAVGVKNSFYVYNGGHGDWSEADNAHMMAYIKYFYDTEWS